MIKEKDKNKKQGKKAPNIAKEILISVGLIEKRVAILEKGVLVDFFMERESLEHSAGSIFKGKVKSVLPGIEAAFIDIGLEKNGFLHISDVVDKQAVLKEMHPDATEISDEGKHKQRSNQKIENILKSGQEIMVQIVKDAIGTKGPRLTTFISIPGRYLVLTPYDNNTGVSRRIDDRKERKRIKDMISKCDFPKNIGCIVRTVSENCKEKELQNEFKYLLKLWQNVKNRYDKNKSPAKVYEEYGIVLQMVRDILTIDIENVTVDSKEEYARIVKFLRSFMPELKGKVKLYKGKTSLFHRYNLDKKIDQIFERKVVLPSGGSLVIEQTEAVVVVDVNSGSYVGKKSLEETAFKTNMEASDEIPKQLLLRDVGGIIIIDFIDMETKEHREKVFMSLQNNLVGDKARVSVRAISQFGVVEMTRQRRHTSIERFSHIDCPYCGGKGVIKSPETIAIKVVREIDKALFNSKKRTKHLKVILHPDVNAILLNDQAKMFSEIQRKYRCKIDLQEDRFTHIEGIIIEEK